MCHGYAFVHCITPTSSVMCYLVRRLIIISVSLLQAENLLLDSNMNIKIAGSYSYILLISISIPYIYNKAGLDDFNLINP